MASDRSESQTTVPAPELQARLARLFTAAGLSPKASTQMAEALIEADLEGLPSHGLLQTDIYLKRLRQGSVSREEVADRVVDFNAIVVLDAKHMFGHLAADQAMALAVERAQALGAGIVAVRHGFHFGMGSRYASAAARNGCIGIAMCNVRPLIPAPGGAERIVGNNPLAIALPTPAEPPIVLDMAMSEAAVAKIRVAQAAGKPIPPTWAVTASGAPTTDPVEALAGMLLPTGGPKGFALAFVIDLMCGLLSGGAWGDGVKGMYDDVTQPVDCSHLFVAIDVKHFRDLDGFKQEAAQAAERLRASKKAPGVDHIAVPGERKWARRRASGEMVVLSPAVSEALARHERELGITAP